MQSTQKAENTDSPDYFDIAPVELRVARNEAGPGRLEKFTSSAHLMRRLDVIGCEQLTIIAVAEAAQPWEQHHVDALNLYLRSLRGLRSFKRVAKMGWRTKWGWDQLREMNGIPTLAIIVSV